MGPSHSSWQQSLELAAERGMAIAYHALRAPSRLAVIAPSGERDFATLNAHSNQLLRALRRAGLGRHSGVAMICSNRPEFLEIHAACQRGGMRLTPANWHLTGEEMAYIVNDCEAEALIVDAQFADAARTALAGSRRVKLALVIDGSLEGFDDYAHVIAAQDAGDIEDPSLGGSMLYTSGTTGHPKGVYRWPPKRSSLAAALMAGTIDFRNDGERALVTGPLYHAAPLNLSAVPALNAGASLVLMERFDAEQVLRLIAEHKIVFTHMVATMFHRMLQLPLAVRQRYDLTSLRAVLHGAAPCPQHIKRALIEWLGPVVFEYYAATEGGGTLVDSVTWLKRPGTVGQALAGTAVRILDEQHQIVNVGETGTVYLKAPPEGRFEYFNAPDKTAAAYCDGYFTMGDHGYLDGDGYLYLTGRNAETIISGGVNIYPQEVDDVLLRSESVFDACTVGVPNDEWGEEVRSVVSLMPGIVPSTRLEAELIALCRRHLAAYKCPRRIEFDNALPRLPSGKVQRHKVRQRFWRDRERTI